VRSNDNYRESARKQISLTEARPKLSTLIAEVDKGKGPRDCPKRTLRALSFLSLSYAELRFLEQVATDCDHTN